MPRTVHLGKPDQRARSVYHAVCRARRAALKAVKAGARADEVDHAARSLLHKAGLGHYFTHSTGHGVGLEIHEKPRLGKGEKAVLSAGCVVTVEPGIYLEGFGGIRIEDSVLVDAEGPEVLTPASKEEWAMA